MRETESLTQRPVDALLAGGPDVKCAEIWVVGWPHPHPSRTWDPTNAVVWCVWTAFAKLAGLGIIRPLKMLPIILLEIFYKVLWLILLAYPLWFQGHVGRFTGGRYHLGILVGDLAHRR
jgi:hypothetical protein